MIKWDQKITKHSINMAGRKTSISLEQAFWDEANTIAAEQNIAFGDFCARIDKHREDSNLSSAIRVYVLDHYKRFGARE